MEPSALVVQAEFAFTGSNNDELCFRKGDLITVTQREEGGWWEGTLDDKTGWFPSNYVNEYKAPLPAVEIIRQPEEIQEYRSVVLKDLLDSECAHVAELKGLLDHYLEPLQMTQILTNDEYAQLMCNYIEVVKTHDEFLKQMENCKDRIGKLFLTRAPLIKQVHQLYCTTHPKAIVILEKYKDQLEDYMTKQGAASPGLLVLTIGLSKPFRRLDKYSTMLQELERHMESSHPDRGDTQRSVAVYKDIAASCSATRRQKELELQVLTGPVRGWQGPELSTFGDIINMGSVAVGSDHRDRYFVLFPQTLLILSVSHRMSAFIYEGKLSLAGITVNRIEDTDSIKNAFEISGPMIERIVAVCQGPNEANKWVELLAAHNHSMPMTLKREHSNLSNSSLSRGTGVASFGSMHMSPPTSNHSLHLANSRVNSTQLNQSQVPAAHQVSTATNAAIATAVSPAGSAVISPLSQHKRSLSFNHHLSYNQYTHAQHPIHYLPPQPPSLPCSLPPTNPKPNLVAPASAMPKTIHPCDVQVPNNRKSINTKANWSINCLRPTPPLRPNLLAQTSGSNSGSGSGAGSSSNTLSSYCSGRKVQSTYEEDALVLRVFEAYSAAYQNGARNTVHSALHPWTPCLPIRAGKLKTSKPFSTSNPQLPFLNNNQQVAGGFSTPNWQGYTQPTSSLNSSFIWREASPNSFNLYSSSVSSLAGGSPAGISAGRYSVSRSKQNTSSGTPAILGYQRALSEERATRKSLNRMKSGFGSGYDNVFGTPLLPRKNKSSPKPVKQVYQVAQQRGPSPSRPPTCSSAQASPKSKPLHPGLYDRRLNRSFEATTSMTNRYAGYGAGYLLDCGGLRASSMQRSTPHLAGDEASDSDDALGDHRACGAATTVGLLDGAELTEAQRKSGTWCCGNFVMKQWRKMSNY